MSSASSDLAASTTPIAKYLVFSSFLLEIKRLPYYHDRCVVIFIVNFRFTILAIHHRYPMRTYILELQYSLYADYINIVNNVIGRISQSDL
jgi:hypothetical protein